MSIRSKLFLLILIVSLASIAVVGYVSFTDSQRALSEAVTDQLTSSRVARANQIEDYFDQIEAQASTMSQDRMITEAMRQFSTAFDQLDALEPPEDAGNELAVVYQRFLDRLGAPDTSADLPLLLPSGNAAVTLQRTFLTAESPRSTTDSADGSFYSRVHARYHSILRDFIDSFGYYDLFLVDAESRDVVYTVEKEIDFATNLRSGPYANTGLAQAVQAALEAPSASEVAFTDYTFYRPSLDAPAGFVASAISDGDEVIGVLAFQFPGDDIDDIMTSNGQWESSGFGATGETFLVGPDGSARSQRRALVGTDTRTEYLDGLAGSGVPDDVIRSVSATGSAVLHLPAVDDASVRAARGLSGTETILDIRGVEYLASYAPLDLGGLDWSIVALTELDEATATITDLQRNFAIATGAVVLVLTGLSVWLAAVVVRPIERLRDWAERAQRGADAPPSERTRQDEYGELAGAMHDLVTELRNRISAASDEAASNEHMVRSLLPAPIADRLLAGDGRIADEYPNVTVAVSRLTGVTDLAIGVSATTTASVLTGLIEVLDTLTDRHGLEKISSVSDAHVVAAGLFESQLDGSRRCVDFAAEAVRAVDSFNEEHRTNIGIAIGIAESDVEAGILGAKRPVFDVWGAAPDQARAFAAAGAPGSISVAAPIVSKLGSVFTFGDVQTSAIGSGTEFHHLTGATSHSVREAIDARD